MLVFAIKILDIIILWLKELSNKLDSKDPLCNFFRVGRKIPIKGIQELKINYDTVNKPYIGQGEGF